jgi:2-hydroxy-4-carboxymuconate semialdehyde hemiacetal dehydrogenase
MKICMVGYGMMGVWHTQALLSPAARGDVELHTAVGRRADAVEQFARRFGYRRWTTSLEEALADPAIDVVILATPSEQHEAQALACFAAHKHVLIEIPIGMSLASAERVVAAGERSGVVWGLCHPMRFQRERIALRERIAAGEEHIRHIGGRFFLHRLTNAGATGYARSWTDNILWHHFCHFVDLGMFLFDYAPIRRVQSHLGPLHPTTGVPMEAVVLVETEDDRTSLVHGSYHSPVRFLDNLIVTDRDTYFFDVRAGTLLTSAGLLETEDEPTNCARVIADLLAAIREGRQPLAAGPTVLPAMRVLQQVQDDWDARWGARSIPGRTLGPSA